MYAKWTLYVGKQNQRGIYTVRIFLLVYLEKSLSFCISTNELCSEAAYDFKLNFNFWLHTRKTLTSKISTAWADTCDLPSSISSIDSEMMLLFLYRNHICMENCEHFIVGNRIRFFYMKFRKKNFYNREYLWYLTSIQALSHLYAVQRMKNWMQLYVRKKNLYHRILNLRQNIYFWDWIIQILWRLMNSDHATDKQWCNRQINSLKSFALNDRITYTHSI